MVQTTKHLLIISAVFPPEQVTSALMTYDIAKELAKKYKITVLRPRPTRPIGVHFDSLELAGEPFETVLVDSYTCPESRLMGRLKESVSFSKQCVKYIKAHKDEIEFIYNGAWQLFGVRMVAKTAVKYNIPYLITVQDIYPESLLTGHHYPNIVEKCVKCLFQPMDKYYTSHAYKVRTISDEMADYMSRTRHIPREHYVVMNNWQNDEDFENLPQKKSKGSRIVFAYVGSINVHANVDLIIKAFQEANLGDAELQIYGGGNRKEQCQELVRNLGVKNISFGQVSREKVPAIQAQADVTVLALPKGNGGICLPSKMTSYMLSGKPILASIDKGSTAERYINEAQCGFAVEPDNLQALTEGFRKFGMMDNATLNQMSENSRRFAEENLTRKANLPKVMEIIENAINKQ